MPKLLKIAQADEVNRRVANAEALKQLSDHFLMLYSIDN